MKLLVLTAIALLPAFATPKANAATFSVIKVSAALKGQYQNDLNRLAKFNLTTKVLINLAQNKDITTPVPKNVVLGYAGVFADFAHNNPNTAGPVMLVVYDTDTQTKLKTIAIASNRTTVENVIVDKFKRVGTATLTIQDTSAGSTTGFFESGSLQVSGQGTRKPNGVATPTNLRITSITSATGTIRFGFTKGSTSDTITVVIAKGALKASGKILGTFDE